MGSCPTFRNSKSQRWLGPLVITIALFGSACTIPGDSSVADVQSQLLIDLEASIRSGEYGNIHSVIAASPDETIVEWYFAGPDQRGGFPFEEVEFAEFSADDLHDVRSLTKSVVSLLFGIALSEGQIASIDDSIARYLSDYSDILTPELTSIRLRHLLSMSSGLGWDERTFPYGDTRNTETALDRAPDRIRYVLSLPVVAPPGERFVYSSGDVELLAQIIARSTQMPLDSYAREKLFGPLGIETFEWAEYEGGEVIASWGLRLRPEDMVKIGQLILQSGVWNERQIVPESWIAEMASPRVVVDSQQGIRYGNFFWFGRIGEGDDAIEAMQAVGNGGQRITLLPGQRLVIVTTAGFYNADDSLSDRVISSLYSTMAAD